MNNRWCIVGSLRSGSTALQHKIFLKLPKPSVTLGEYTHFEVSIYQDSSGKFIKKEESFYNQDRIKFRKDMQELFETTDNSYVMKVFPQPWILVDFDYVAFLKNLAANKFKFIHVHRDFFSRVISYAMAQTTGLWHRQYTKVGLQNLGKDIKLASISNKVVLDINVIENCIIDICKHDEAINEIMTKVGEHVYNVNYLTMDDDCETAGIPIVDKSPHVKTYDTDYADIIENYEEIKNLKDWQCFTLSVPRKKYE